MRNPEFGRLLTGAINSIAAYEGKTASTIEAELGSQLSIAPSTIQRYKAGYVPPEYRVVEMLAEIGIKRGYLTREWLKKLLHTAHYPAPNVIVERLFPDRPLAAQPIRVYQNLPAPTYNRFVMRTQAYADITDGLRQRSAVVLIASLGGMGKTSLAREVCARCLSGDSDTPRFAAVVWVSDKGREGATNLSVVLDEIARTLDYPGFISLAFEEKRYEVEQLLRRQRVLLVIDNFETITDSALLAWLLRLPEPSKALVTSREYHKEFRSSWPVDLRGMSETEAQEFVANQLRFLRMDKLVEDQSQLTPLLEVTGGNPKAIMIALGCVKHEHRPLAEVLNDLYNGRGDLFEDLFTRSWRLLDDAAQRVLMSMALFPVSTSEEALTAVSAVPGFVFSRAIERLTDMALLDMSRADIQSAPRFALHPLVRSFAAIKLKSSGDFEPQARQRWVEWCLQLAAEVKNARHDLRKIKILALDEETMDMAIQWCYQNDCYPETNLLIDRVGYYYHVRGMWDKKVMMHPMAIEVARRHESQIEEINALASYVQVLSRQDKIAEAAQYLPRLRALATAEPLPDDVQMEYLAAESFYWMAQNRIDQVEQIWQQNMHLANSANGHMVRSWLADCLLAKRDWLGAQTLLRESLHDVAEKKIQRGMIAIQIKLVGIYLEQGNIQEAAAALTEISQLAGENLDRRYMAFIHNAYARFYTLQGDTALAKAAFKQAIDLFERVGMRRELNKARLELESLEG